ncbi:DNA repair protein REV1 [Galleria mellonella]|uniref:DNA repair protein REV1 n=1 Tax=Galleria mellonella TaxID=7137 RepID=A0A6J1WGR2_GALME|nr:DNA repair protein REV1 [Galleria mellonella]
MWRRDNKFPDNGFEQWGGYMQAKINKLEEQFSSRAGNEAKESNIFNGVSIYVNGFTVPSADELKVLMVRHGGVYHTYQKNNDYIIASNLPDTKVKNMSLARVVKPEWITDSIKSNHLLDYREYLLYRNSITQPQLNFAKVSKTLNSLVENAPQLKQTVSGKENDISNFMKKEEKEIDQFMVSEVKMSNDIKQPDKSFSNSKVNNQSKVDDIDSAKFKNINDINKIIQTTKTAADPNFISEFYNNSRLHHISQLGACFKQYVNDLREKTDFLFPSRAWLKEEIFKSRKQANLSQLNFENGKVIMHIDMDCFFVSVGLRNRPELRGKPVAVTHSKGGQFRTKRSGVDRNTEFQLYRQRQAKQIGKAAGIPEEEVEFESRVDNIADEDDKYGCMSEIASCSYEARAKGISNGMFMGAALKLCPDLQTISYDFEGYKEVAFTLYNTIAQYTLDIEAVSCDEMYVDCTELLKDTGIGVQEFATFLRTEIKSKTGCPCSTGFGGNRLQARLATKHAKPDGQFFLIVELVEDFMFNIKLKDLPGVGRQTAQKLESIGHQTCGSLQSLSLAILQNHFGNKTGALLFDQCRGRDTTPLTFFTVRKSVSAEVNYGIRFENNNQCIEFLKQLSVEVQTRMQQYKVLGKCITLKLMVRAEEAPVETAKFMGHGFCNVINKSTSLNNATNDVEVITKEVISLWKKQNIDPKEMRGVGIQITKLDTVNNKPIKGTLSKFLVNVKTKTEEKCNSLNIPESVDFKSKPECKPDFSTKNSSKTTPKKTKSIAIAKQKSPVTVFPKSPSGKRGRPPKVAKIQVPSRNLLKTFIKGSNIKDTPYKNPMVNTVMPEIEIVKKEEKPQGLLSLPWEKIRELLRAWLDSGQTPLPCDVGMVTEYMCEMVVNKNIDKLYILIKFLRRRTSEIGSDDWKEVYKIIIENVQNAMIAVYGKPLFLGD